jgi:Cu/Zn superoxide dismutase
VTLGGADGFVGRSVVIHASGDNADVQPNGTAGPGIACGVIAAQ